MLKLIAVFLGNNEKTTSFEQSGIIRLYSKETSGWKVINEVPFDISNETNIKNIREEISLLSENINPCKIMVGSKITGLPYNILDKNGFNIWEIEGNPKEFLDYVLEHEENESLIEESKNKSTDIKPYPIKTNEDRSYFLDLIKLQEQDKSISSKRAIVPFLEKESFYKLEIVCTHIPPWIEIKAKEYNWKLEVLKLGTNELKLIILNEA